MGVVGRLHYIWAASGCCFCPCSHASDGLRRGEQDLPPLVTVVCRAVMGRKAAFLASGGYGPSSIQRHLLHFAARRAMCSSGSCSSCGAGGCDGGERHARRDGGRVRQWARHALGRVKAARAGGRDAPRCAQLCMCVIAMLSVRMPVHDVVESDRTNRAYSDYEVYFL